MNAATRDDEDESSDAISIDDISDDEEEETFVPLAQQAQLWPQVTLPHGNVVASMPAASAALPTAEEDRLAREALIDQVMQEERHRLMVERGLSRDQVLGMAPREGAMLIVELNVEARERALARLGLPAAERAAENETQEALDRQRANVEASNRGRAQLPQPGPQMTHVPVNMAQSGAREGGREGGARVEGREGQTAVPGHDGLGSAPWW